MTGNHLEDLRVSLRRAQNPVSPKAPSLILWTERGDAPHVKILTTDQAWDVFDQPADGYCNKISHVEPCIRLKQYDNFAQAFLVQGAAITQINALFQCAKHL